MSTVKNNTINRFAVIASLGEQIFHVEDLAFLWNISDKNTLHTTLKRYTQKGLLYRIQRGLYSVKNLNNVDKYLLGLKSIHSFAYITTETVLVENGIIMQSIDKITMASSKSLNFEILGNFYKSRQMADEFLFNDYGVEKINGIMKATPERAVADMLYFNPKAYFDGQSLINWGKVKDIQKKVYDTSKS